MTRDRCSAEGARRVVRHARAVRRGGSDLVRGLAHGRSRRAPAHREKRPDAALGIVLPGPFAKHTERVIDQYKGKGYDVMVQELRHGPPKYFRVGPMAALNVGENWIHHEDVRRANGESPRPADPEIDDILWGSLKTATFMARRKLKTVGLVLKTPDGQERVVKQADPLVTIVGAPGRARVVHVGPQGGGRRASRRPARSGRHRPRDEARDLAHFVDVQELVDVEQPEDVPHSERHGRACGSRSIRGLVTRWSRPRVCSCAPPAASTFFTQSPSP